MAEPLGQMVIELGLDSSSFGKGLTGAKQQVKYAMAEMKSGMSVMSASGKQLDVLAAKQRGLTSVITAQERVVKSLKKSYDDSFVNGKATQATTRLATQLQNANAKLASFRTQLANNASAMAKARVETTGWTGALNKVSKASSSIGGNLSSMGSKVSKVSAPLALGFSLAAKSAIDFDSQISAMGPLLTNGGAVTAKFRAQLDELASSSKKWSMQYGISTTEINNAMSEMIKRGFTTKQVMGSMPAVLDASKASGESLGTVMQATASIVEQFGLKANSTKGTIKNTQRVTDALTYSANATAAGFSDMTLAMSYVGPQAKASGISVEATAAAIGELAQKGIDGQKAGTSLRGILTSLVKVSPNATKAFKSMGISTAELKKDSNDLPRLIDDITKGTEGWSKADKNKAIATIFGRENQSAMNALISTGSDKLRELTTATENSGGATKKIADQLNDTKANQIKRFQSSVQLLGVTIGEKLLPTLTPLVKEATNVINGFSKMDDSTQQLIIHMGLAVAAGGPLLKLTDGLFSGFGKLGSGVVGVIGKYEGWRAKTAVLNGTVKGTETVVGGMSNTVGNSSGIVDQFGKTLTTANSTANNVRSGFSLLGSTFLSASGEAGVLGTAISPLGATIIGVGAAVAAGTVIWEAWGKKAYESSQRASKWGSDVGAAADKSLTKMSQFVTTTNAQLDTFGTSSSSSAKKMGSEFNKAFKQMENDSKTSINNMQKEVNKLPESVRGDAQRTLNEKKKNNAALLKEDETLTKNVNGIFKRAGQEHRKLTADENTYVRNAQQKLANDEVSLLNISASKKKAIQKALNGDVKHLNQQQIDDAITGIHNLITEEQKGYSARKKNLKKSLDDGIINQKQYNTQLNNMQKDHKATMMAYLGDDIALWKKQGASVDQINQALSAYGVTYDQVMKANQQAAQKAAKSNSSLMEVTNDMNKHAKKAANDWNALVFNPKTGKLKSNAQEEVNNAAKSNKKWEEMVFNAKKANASSNVKAMVITAGVSSGQWNKMSFKDKKAILKTEGKVDITDALIKSGEWNNLSLKQQKAIIKSDGGAEMMKTLQTTGAWNSLSLKEQVATIKDNATGPMKGVKLSTTQWNSMPVSVKNAIVNDMASGKMSNANNLVRGWNTMPISVKNAIANDLASGKIKHAHGTANAWNSMSMPMKHALANDLASGNVNKARSNVSAWNRLPASKKSAIAKDNASGPARHAISAIRSWNRQSPVTHVFKSITEYITKHIKGKKTGSRNYEGGPAMVNDQMGATFRELIQLPTGEQFIPQGRNVVMDIPMGSKIYTAHQTARMFPGLPQFAEGLNVPASADIVRQPKEIVNTIFTNNNQGNAGIKQNNDLFDQVSALAKGVSDLVTAIKSQNGKEVAVILDSDVMARGVAPLITKEQERLELQSNRLRGIK
jgi:TP901 family phage tail tape measure protein